MWQRKLQQEESLWERRLWHWKKKRTEKKVYGRGGYGTGRKKELERKFMREEAWHWKKKRT